MRALYTVDTELSLMMQLRGRSPGENYRSAILGETSEGAYGVGYQLDMLDRHGLTGVFFVEALHTATIGSEQLKRLVDLIGARGHEIQLHCHIEWLWFHPGTLKLPRTKQSLCDLGLDEQTKYIGMAKEALEAAGAPAPNAFRAGNYGANDDTLRALAALGIAYDSSFNRTEEISRIDLPPAQIAPIRHHGVVEVPVSWFFALPGKPRHTQLCAVSAGELKAALAQARRLGHPYFNIVSHSFELLSRDRQRPQHLVIRRFEELCRVLAEEGYETGGFREMKPPVGGDSSAQPIQSNAFRTAHRMAEQAIGNFLYERG